LKILGSFEWGVCITIDIADSKTEDKEAVSLLWRKRGKCAAHFMVDMQRLKLCHDFVFLPIGGNSLMMFCEKLGGGFVSSIDLFSIGRSVRLVN
jgi:hypothetical protein